MRIRCGLGVLVHESEAKSDGDGQQAAGDFSEHARYLRAFGQSLK